MANQTTTQQSPFFRPKGGTLVASGTEKEEHKSTILGCSSNLINAIVGAGIVGLPFAIQESGFVPGILLVLVSALLTEKSLRLLIETAKHANVGSYETLAEAAFGNFGFRVVSINMFVMAYGAMLSYLMIVKDTVSSILGITDPPMKRAVLVAISSMIILPLSCQRDMADLAKTSKMNVCFDLLMVLIVVYLAVLRNYNNEDSDRYENADGDQPISVNGYLDAPFVDRTTNNNNHGVDLWQVRWDTIFVGLGVLSFAFVCQHSAFIIAGSLERPTQQRWSSVTRIALGFAASLALLMGIVGYLGFGDIAGTFLGGNVLNSLPPDSFLAKIAKGLLGTTMLFVYPMESFVARHACVVLFFEGRTAHEGDDTSVLNRRDRRITLTTLLYLSALVPAAMFDDLGNVLAISGSLGGSCLSYIGPGIVFLGIHGDRFLELSESYFCRRLVSSSTTVEKEKIALIGNGNESDSPKLPENDCLSCKTIVQTLLWYVLGMPLWTFVASVGKTCLTSHVTDMALRSPHPIRIGNVRFARATIRGGTDYTRVVVLQSPHNLKPRSASDELSDSQRLGVTTKLLRQDSFPRISNTAYKVQTTTDGTVVALPPSSMTTYQSINQKIGAMALANAKTKQEQFAIEDDPQGDPPGVLDFLVAISYVLFGLVAMIAGLMSIFFS
jgi:sodium-coupled neutral amino acid transporter 11